ncbi:MAG: decaprenyl-phosphate phosphoribosyltransferase [Melioribacteraceae bacterium]|nr:decaprenyl-phosphate phosphoribosyltransferase [Melioribacteraceae bacterium]MCF8395111.1 decaprenyl-phosphate phosphoribosyltransferase [Melioribacteraceae bacterium]MCF8420520.1 decaprenyl-phosphate phosphoribosyltransferase [Melioribacteraceae bacterium]
MAKDYLKLIRVSHWIKNLFVFVPLTFSKHLFDQDYLFTVLIAFFAFSLASSFVYVFNDILDADLDRKHPVKKLRPIASGKIKPFQAVLVLIVLAALFGSLTSMLNWQFNLTLVGYLLLNVFYTLILKKIVIIDLLCLALGFMLRVMGGAFVIAVYISSWLILTTLFVSIFLAVMKRRSELINEMNRNDTRIVLKEYSKEFIDQISAISAGGVIISYSLYSVSDRTIEYFGTEGLVFTTLFVVYGVFRYMYLVMKKERGENTTEIILSDLPMIINTLLYAAVVITIIYFRN